MSPQNDLLNCFFRENLFIPKLETLFYKKIHSDMGMKQLKLSALRQFNVSVLLKFISLSVLLKINFHKTFREPF